MHGSQCVLKPAVCGAGIYKTGEAQLFYPSQALHVRMFQQIKNETGWKDYKPMYRIINDLPLVDDFRHEKLIIFDPSVTLSIQLRLSFNAALYDNPVTNYRKFRHKSY